MLCCKCKKVDVPDDNEVARGYSYIEDNDDDQSKPFEWRVCNSCCTEIIFQTMIDNCMWEAE